MKKGFEIKLAQASQSRWSGLIICVLTLGLNACESSTSVASVSDRGATSDSRLPTDSGVFVSEPPAEDSSVSESPFSSCRGKEGVICLGLKSVVFQDSTGAPTVSSVATETLVKGVNAIWSKCGIAFQVDEYLSIKPSDFGLSYQTANYSDLTQIRNEFGDSDTLLLVTTGPWNRSGSLGNTGANAWTSMPGESALGVVMEKSVGTYTPLVAHELGHYLSLDHQNAISSLMSAIIYTSSTELSSAECEAAEETVYGFWNRMLR